MQSRKPLILVVEDNNIVRFIAISNLRKYASNTHIHIAENGRMALEAVKVNQYALILMDINMPEMDGLEATRAIRLLDFERGRWTPIVAVTAGDSAEECFKAGVDDYVHKPADYKRILEKWLTPAIMKRVQ